MRNPTLLITRPMEDGAAFMQQLTSIGIDGLLAPMITIEHKREAPQEIDALIAEHVQAIIITSKNAVSTLVKSHCKRTQPILAVGDATARLLRLQGFSEVTAAEGTAADLFEKALKLYRPELGRIIHIAGSKITLDIAQELSQRQFIASRIIAYDMHPATSLSNDILRAHKQKDIDAVSFFSVQTAHTYKGLVQKYALAEDIALMEAFCLSGPVAEAAKQLKWRKIHTSAVPSLPSMLSCVKEQFYNHRI